MNAQSLLLGSAAAFLLASGSYAADAVVIVEPEPAEYVRICDVYGAGYFYIPGTETCLRIGGYIRYDIGGGDLEGHPAVDVRDSGSNHTYHKQARLALRTWTGAETELGTLKTFTETRFETRDRWGSHGETGWSLNGAWVQLGGLRIGRDDSVFITFTGYAGAVIDDGMVPYGPFGTNLISYYFDAGSGFSAVVSLEEGGGANTIDSYVPHVLVGAKYTQGWGSIAVIGAYDSNWEEFTVKARLNVKVAEQLSLFFMGGFGTSDVTTETMNGGYNFYKVWDGDWAMWAGATYQVSEKASLNVQASYDEGETFGLATNVAYTIVPGFTVTAEIDYSNWSSTPYHITSGDAVGGTIRFQRSF